MNCKSFCKKIISMIDIGWMQLDELEGMDVDILKEMNYICTQRIVNLRKKNKDSKEIDFYKRVNGTLIKLLQDKGQTFIMQKVTLEESNKELSQRLLKEFLQDKDLVSMDETYENNNDITPLEINKNHYLSKREKQKEWKKFSQKLLEEIYGKDNSSN